MEHLKLDKNTALRIYDTADNAVKSILEESFGKEIFSRDICDRIKTWEDVCEYHKIHPVSILPYPTPINDRQEAANAFVKDDYITDALNEGVVLDYDNKDQEKWYLWLEKTASGFVLSTSGYSYNFTHTFVGARLSFVNKKVAEHYWKYFKENRIKIITRPKK